MKIGFHTRYATLIKLTNSVQILWTKGFDGISCCYTLIEHWFETDWCFAYVFSLLLSHVKLFLFSTVSCSSTRHDLFFSSCSHSLRPFSLSVSLTHSLTLCDLNFVFRFHFVVDETAQWNRILLFSRFLNVVIAARKIALKWNRVWLCLRERVDVDVCDEERVTQSNHNVLHCTARP